jgi:hypothetical protein
MVKKGEVGDSGYYKLIGKKIKVNLSDGSFVIGVLDDVNSEFEVFQIIEDKRNALTFIAFDKVIRLSEWMDDDKS